MTYVLDSWNPKNRYSDCIEFDTLEEAIYEGSLIWSRMSEEEQDVYTSNGGYIFVHHISHEIPMYDWANRYAVDCFYKVKHLATLDEAIKYCVDQINYWIDIEGFEYDQVRDELEILDIYNPRGVCIIDFFDDSYFARC